MDKDENVTPDVSVIITAYNVERYIERAIRSALDQHGVSVEVIFIDDNSTDQSWQVAMTIDDPRLQGIRLPANLGPGGARNAGIAKASGTWIAVLDGDDAFLPGRLIRLLAKAVQAKADIVVDNLRVSREADSAEFPMFAKGDFAARPVIDLVGFINGNCRFLGGYTLGYLKPFFSASFLREHALAYDPQLRIGEDYILLADALASGARCCVEPQEGYLYTVRASSISHRLSLQDVTRIANADKKFVARHTLDSAAVKAQGRREHSLQVAYAFTQLIGALKKRDMAAALKIVAVCPSAGLQLWRPLMARILSKDAA